MEKRPLKDVIRAIRSLIPKDWERWAPLTARLQSISESWDLSPPEMRNKWWHETCEALGRHLDDPPVLDWQKTISQIIKAERDYKEFLPKELVQ